MSTIHFCKGLPGSGKSTWAKQFVKESNGQVKRVNKDELRSMVDAGIWSKTNEKFVLRLRDDIIHQCLRQALDVIIDDTNLSPQHLEQISYIADQYKGTKIVIRDFTHVSLSECIQRDKNRPNYVGEDVIRDMYKRYLEKKILNENLPPERNPNLPDAIICDLDGTLALMRGRSPYDESKAIQDAVNGPILDIVKASASKGVKIILVSGRDSGRGLDATQQWLTKHDVPYLALYLRKAGDTRKDTIIKQEIYDAHIKGKFNILFVLDDRNCVVDKWRELGLTCLQVAPGDF